jgi:hypothetical protein
MNFGRRPRFGARARGYVSPEQQLRRRIKSGTIMIQTTYHPSSRSTHIRSSTSLDADASRADVDLAASSRPVTSACLTPYQAPNT